MIRHNVSWWPTLAAGLLWFLLMAVPSHAAAATLTIQPITWNVIGLDSNNVNSGPNLYPVGARVCNTGSTAATGVTARIVFDGGITNPYLSVSGSTSLTLADLPSGPAPAHPNSLQAVPSNCQDAYFNVQITRNTAAYSSRISDTATPAQRNTQLYHIEASATGAPTVSTPTPRELYVEKLVSQNRNSVISFTGPSSVSVGQVVQLTLRASTATGGYEQLEHFPILPNTVFQVLDVNSTYTSPTGGVNSTVYGDACGWENMITSVNYHNNGSCLGPAHYAGAKVGNAMTTVYTVRIIAGGTQGVFNVIYDYSGSSYHYNSDYGTAANGYTVTASAPDLTLTKTHTGTFTVGQTGSFTFTVSSAAAAAYGATTLTDTLPTGLSLPDGALTLSGANASSWACSSASNTITCTSTNATNMPAIAAGGSSTFTVPGIVVGAAAAPGVTNTARVSNPNETVTSNNTASDPVTVTPVTDVAVSQGVSRVFAGPGQTLTYTTRVWNNGPNAASTASITDTVPPVLSNVTWTCAPTGSATCSAASGSGNSINLTAGLPVDSGLTTTADTQYVTVAVTGTLSSTASGTVSNTATGGHTNDSNSGNNSAAVSTAVVDAVNDSAVSFGYGTGGTVPVLGNDTVGGVAATTSSSAVTISANGGLNGLSVNASGQLVVPSTANAGTYTVTYRLCSVTDPSACDTATVPVTISAGMADLAVTKTDGVASVTAGGTTTYTIVLTNNGPSGAGGAILSDPAVSGLNKTGVSCTAAGGAVCPTLSVGSLESGVSVATLPSGGALTVTVITSVTATSGSVSNTATASVPSGTTDPTSGNNAATDTDTVNPIADLSVTTTDGVGTFHVGSVLTYTVVVRNAGPSTASGATVSDPLPTGIAAANMTYSAAASSGATTTVTGTKTGALSDTVTLAPGSQVTYTVTVTVPSGYAGGSLTNTATVTAPAGLTDPATANNTASDTDTREAPVANPDAAGTNPLVPVTFSVTNNDTGPVDPATVDLDPSTPGTQTTVTDPGKGHYSVDASGAVTFTPVAGFTSGTSRIPYTVKDSLGVGSNVATITVTVPVGADLGIAKTGPAYAAPGDALTYTLTVTNTMAIPASASTVTDTLASVLTFVSASGGGTYDSSTRTVTWTLPSLWANAQQVVTVTVTAPSAAQVRGGTTSVQNTATVTLPGDPDSTNNTSVPVTTRMVLNEITKSVRNVTADTRDNGGTARFGTVGSGKPGEVLEYCLTARNLGGVDLGTATSGYTVRDVLPANVQALANAYDAASSGNGSGIQVERSSTTAYLTSAADGDAGTLSSSAGTYGSGSLTVNLGILTAGESAITCFQAAIR